MILKINIYRGLFTGSTRSETAQTLIMLEKDIVAAIMRHLKTRSECFAYKTHGGMYGTAGLPDIVCCYRGCFVGLEVKQPGKTLTVLQGKTITKINAAGGIAAKVTSVEEVKTLLAGIGGDSI